MHSRKVSRSVYTFPWLCSTTNHQLASTASPAPGYLEVPPSPRSARTSTHSPATADLSLGDQSVPVSDLPGASSAPPALVYTASGVLGSLASTQLQQSPGLHNPAQERCPQGSSSVSSQCLPCLQFLTLPSWLCLLVHTFCNLVSGERKGNLVILLQPRGVAPNPLLRFLVVLFFFCF